MQGAKEVMTPEANRAPMIDLACGRLSPGPHPFWGGDGRLFQSWGELLQRILDQQQTAEDQYYPVISLSTRAVSAVAEPTGGTISANEDGLYG